MILVGIFGHSRAATNRASAKQNYWGPLFGGRGGCSGRGGFSVLGPDTLSFLPLSLSLSSSCFSLSPITSLPKMCTNSCSRNREGNLIMTLRGIGGACSEMGRLLYYLRGCACYQTFVPLSPSLSRNDWPRLGNSTGTHPSFLQ